MSVWNVCAYLPKACTRCQDMYLNNNNYFVVLFIIEQLTRAGTLYTGIYMHRGIACDIIIIILRLFKKPISLMYPKWFDSVRSPPILIVPYCFTSNNLCASSFTPVLY